MGIYICVYIFDFQPIQVLNAGNGKAVLAQPAGQILRQIQPVTIPPTVGGHGVITATPTVIHKALQPSTTGAAVQPSLPTVQPFFNNSSTIRVRLPNTPTPPNLLQHPTAQIIQHQRSPILPNTPVSATIIRPTSTLITRPEQVQIQPPAAVGIQNNQGQPRVIIHPQQVVHQSPQTIIQRSSPLNASSTNNALMTSSAGGLAAIRPGQAIVPGNNILIGSGQNLFRVPTPTTGGSTSATVIVEASGVGGQALTSHIPQSILVRATIFLFLIS